MTTPFRSERDSMGVLNVPANAYYGANTRRAELNFPISDLRFGRSFISSNRSSETVRGRSQLRTR